MYTQDCWPFGDYGTHTAWMGKRELVEISVPSLIILMLNFISLTASTSQHPASVLHSNAWCGGLLHSGRKQGHQGKTTVHAYYVQWNPFIPDTLGTA